MVNTGKSLREGALMERQEHVVYTVESRCNRERHL